jgi:hypothetical protein
MKNKGLPYFKRCSLFGLFYIPFLDENKEVGDLLQNEEGDK